MQRREFTASIPAIAATLALPSLALASEEPVTFPDTKLGRAFQYARYLLQTCPGASISFVQDPPEHLSGWAVLCSSGVCYYITLDNGEFQRASSAPSDLLPLLRNPSPENDRILYEVASHEGPVREIPSERQELFEAERLYGEAFMVYGRAISDYYETHNERPSRESTEPRCAVVNKARDEYERLQKLRWQLKKSLGDR